MSDPAAVILAGVTRGVAETNVPAAPDAQPLRLQARLDAACLDYLTDPLDKLTAQTLAAVAEHLALSGSADLGAYLDDARERVLAAWADHLERRPQRCAAVLKSRPGVRCESPAAGPWREWCHMHAAGRVA